MVNPLRALDRIQRYLRNHLMAMQGMPWSPPVLDIDSFEGKRVIIIGPAQTVFEDLADTRVDEYDVVVRLNNGIALAQTYPEILGRRTDILIHNLREEGERSAGRIPGPYLNDNGVGLVVYPRWSSARLRRLYKRKRTSLKREGGPPVVIMPPSMTRMIRAELDDREPTVGTCSVLFFLSGRAAEVAIHGFTFFETTYAPGYNEAVKTAADARAWVDRNGVHEPLSEKALLRRRLMNATKPIVTLGTHVRHHLGR